MSGDTAGLGPALAAWDLPHGYRSSLSITPTHDDAAWAHVLELVGNHKLTAFAEAAVRAGALAPTPAQHRALMDVHRFLSLRVLFLENVLLQIVGALRVEGIDHRVLKGAALAHLSYPAPKLRPYVDVDLLVPSDRFDDAVDLLTASGAERVHVEPRRGFVSRFGKSVELMRPDHASIDLHCSLAPGAFALTIRRDELFEHASAFTVAGEELRALDPTDRFLHACFHAVVGNPTLKLMPIRDVLQTLVGLDTSVAAVLDRARRWKAEAVVARALVQTWTVLGIEGDHELVTWARRHEPSAAEQEALALALRTEGSTEALGVFAMLRAIPRPLDRARYLSAVLFPSRAYLDERGIGGGARIRRGAGMLVRALR